MSRLPLPLSTPHSIPINPNPDLVNGLFPDADDTPAASLPPPVEETLLRIPGAILHLIHRQRSVELASGDFTFVRLRQGVNTVAVLARIGLDDNSVQWPLARDEAAVKLDDSHYFFSLHVPATSGAPRHDDDGAADILNYGLTLAAEGQEELVKELDTILENYSSFSVQRVAPTMQVLDGPVVALAEVMRAGPKKDTMEETSTAYWTALAPNVEDYSSSVARVIAVGSGELIKGILWCGDVTVDRLKWGEDLLKRRMSCHSEKTEISRDALERMKRIRSVTMMSEKVASGVLSGAIKISGFFTSSIVNSKTGKKFFSLLPGEIVLASLDGFGKICDAVEVVGKNVMQTSSLVTTRVVSHRYGEQAGEITNEGINAVGHAFWTVWTVLKIPRALNPKNAMKPTSLAKSAVKKAKAAAAAAASNLKSKKWKSLL